MNKKFKMIFFALGLAVFVILISEFGVENIFKNIQKTGWWFIPVIGVWGIVYVVNSLAWYFIIDGKKNKLSFTNVFQVTVSGFAINYITPFVGLGGEPYRILALKDSIGLSNSITSVLLYTMLHFLSNFIFWITAIISAAITLTLTSNMQLIFMLAFVVLILLSYFMIHRHKYGLLEFCLKSFSKIPGISKLTEKINSKTTSVEEIDRLIADFYMNRRKSFYAALGLDLVARLVAVLEFYFIFQAIGIDVTLLQSFFISAGSSLIMNMFFFIPFELGAKEGGMYIILEVLKFSPAIGVYIAIVNRLREFFWIFIGLILIQFFKQPRSKRRYRMSKTENTIIKAIIFDFGGTIDTDGIHWFEKFWDKYQLFGVPVSKECYKEAYVHTENDIPYLIKINDNLKNTLLKQTTLQFEYLVNNGKLLISDKNTLVEKITTACYVDVLNNITEVKNILEHLSHSFKLGIVSNYYGNLLSVLNDLKILKYFDTVVDSNIVDFKKPNPKIFKTALKNLEESPSNTVVVGDSYERDIQPAKQLGCKTVWLDGRSWFRPHDVRDADIIIHSLINDLLSLLD